MTLAPRPLRPASLDDTDLRSHVIGEAASMVARIPKVRTILRSFQQQFASLPGGSVLDGRDIGTVVCPHADVKIFVTARPEIRAERRYLERKARGEPVSLHEVLEDIRRRDARDADRADSPMRPADDAFLLDTSNLDIEAAFNTAVGVILRKVGQRGRS
jgi:CMP/dCMP kinase